LHVVFGHPHRLFVHVSFVTEQVPQLAVNPSEPVSVPQFPPFWPMFVHVGGASHVCEVGPH
jgi:hypothetical protein